MDSGLRLWGIMTASAIVVSNDSPTLVKVAARLAKVVFGNRIQICGATVNQVEIMAALNALPDEGGKVILFGHLFSINATIFFPTKGSVFLEGQGIGATQISLADNSDCNMVEFSPTALTIFGGMSRVMLYGNKTNQASGHGIFTTNADGGSPDDLNFTEVIATDIKEDGFNLLAPWGYHIVNCLMEYCDGDGIWMNGIQNYLLNVFSAYNGGSGFVILGARNHGTNLNSQQSGEDGIYLRQAIEGCFTGLRVYNWGSKGANTYIGINIHANSINLSIAGAVVVSPTGGYNPWKGICIDADNCVLSAVRVRDCTDDGIEINGDNNSVQGTCLDNATVSGTNLDDNGVNNNILDLINTTGQSKKLKPNVIRWVLPGWYFTDIATQAFAAGVIYYTPINVEETTTYIRVGIDVTAGSAGTADIRIFEWNNGVPGALVAELGALDTTNIAAVEAVISQELKGRTHYFLAVLFTGTPTLTVPSTSSAIKPPVSGYLSDWGATGKVVLTVTAAYDDPAPAPTGGATARFAPVRLREN